MMQRNVVFGFPSKGRCLWINRGMVLGFEPTHSQWGEVFRICPGMGGDFGEEDSPARAP